MATSVLKLVSGITPKLYIRSQLNIQYFKDVDRREINFYMETVETIFTGNSSFGKNIIFKF